MKNIIAIVLMCIMVLSILTSCDFFEYAIWDNSNISGEKITANKFWYAFDEYASQYENEMPKKWKMVIAEGRDTANYSVIEEEDKIIAHIKTYSLSRWDIIQNETLTTLINNSGEKEYSIYEIQNMEENLYDGFVNKFKEYFDLFAELEVDVLACKMITYTLDKQEDTLVYSLSAIDEGERITASFTVINGELIYTSVNFEGWASIRFTFGEKVPNIIVPSLDEYTVVEDLLVEQ